MKSIKIILSLILIFLSTDIFSQTINEQYNCQFFAPSGSNTAIAAPFGGRVKPNRTDRSGGQPAPADAYFPVLVVFVQFKNEPSDPRGSWPQDSSPTYLNKMISKQKRTAGNCGNITIKRQKFYHLIGQKSAGEYFM